VWELREVPDLSRSDRRCAYGDDNNKTPMVILFVDKVV
jgi:hypothetical protein